jgi:subtilase family serine protease
LSDADLERYAPSIADFATVRAELLHQGFEVLSADPHRFSLRVKGSVASIERAFQTELHQFSFKGQAYQAHVRDAALTGRAGPLVEAVAGLERHAVTPLHTVATNPVTGLPLSKGKISDGSVESTLLAEITDVALSPATDFNFTTSGASLPVVSFTPAQLQSHYGLPALYKAGYDGKGQSIALIEGYDYAKAQADANLAAGVFGRPALTAANFEVIYPEGKPSNPNLADLTGWTIEIALDIQSAHSIAPGAKIVVVATNGQDNEDFIASLQFVISNKIAHTVSNSWEEDTDISAAPLEKEAFNSVLKQGAAAGISIQFSSGDSGDGGLGTPLGAPGVPSNSPYATAIGGNSILNDPYGSGSGGGESTYFAKPAWQKSLPGTGRQVPDFAALADPYTGFPLIFTSAGTLYAQAGRGGTSLASPIFTAIWPLGSADTSLTVAPGWDNVTGYGEPNGLPFIQAVTGKTTGARVE